MQDPALVNGHYRAWTMRNAPRDPIPDVNQEWKIQCQNQPQPIWNLTTPAGLPYGLVSASFQGAVRQGRILEAMQWCLEMIGSDGEIENNNNSQRRVGKGETNFWTRAYIICAEDISLANPVMLTIAAMHLTSKVTYQTFEDAQRGALSMTLWLTKSMKTRVADWACICRVPIKDPYDITLFYNKLLEHLANGNHVLAIAYAEAFIERSLSEKEAKIKDSLPKAIFDILSAGVTVKGSKIKHYNNCRQLTWVAIMKMVNYINNNPQTPNKKYPVVTQIVEACYDLAHDDRYRWEIPGRLFDRTAILTVCLRNDIEERGLDFKAWTGEDMEVENVRLHHRNNKLWFGISDICKDKHSKIGKEMGRGLQHFIEQKAFLRHEDPAFYAMSDFYLDLCFKTRFVSQVFDKSGVSSSEYAVWLRQLRKRNNDLNQIENAIAKETITITFCEVMENHVGMQKIGTLAPIGFTIEELVIIEQNFRNIGVETLLYNLNQGLNGTNVEAEPACLLILRNVGDRLASYSPDGTNNSSSISGIDYAFLELMNLDWDKKAFMKGRVVNKKARHNLCFGDFQQEPTYEEGKGRVINFNTIPGLKAIRDKLGNCFGPKAHNLLAEGNRYYDLKTCMIAKHGDAERRIVIGLRLGGSMSLEYRWYHKTNPVGREMVFTLNHGDIYIMSNKAVGSDWRKSSILTLRHSANMAGK